MPRVFLGNAQCDFFLKSIKFCSWNICEVKDKLQNNVILSFVLNFHIIWLVENRSNHKFSVPGFSVYNNPSKVNVKRGGIALFMKTSLVQVVHKVDMGAEGQIWLELTCFPEHVISGVYIPPEDSIL